MQKTPLIQKIEKIITPTASAMGFDIVRVILVGSGRPTLQIMAERAADGAITLDECGKLSQAISAVLDVEGVMDDTPYFLEVGSPGIDRPLTRLKDFDRFAGKEAKIEIEPALDGRKRFKGTLLGIRGETIRLKTEEGEVEIPFTAVQKAKLAQEDVLLAQKKPQRKKA